MPLFVNFPGFSCSFWERLRTVGKKCMFNYFLEHAGALCCLCVQVRIQNVLENTKAVFHTELCVKTEW